MDVVGTADPYFVAKIDNSISFVYVFDSHLFVISSHITSMRRLIPLPVDLKSYEITLRRYGMNHGRSKTFQRLRRFMLL